MGRATDQSQLFDSWMNRLSHIVGRLVPLDYIWYRGTPIVSFTFDDFPLSAATRAADILERHHAVGTFYAATELLGAPHPLWEMATNQICNGWFPLATRLDFIRTNTSFYGATRRSLSQTTWRATPIPLSRAYATLFRSPLPTLMGFAISDIRSGFQTS